MRWLPLLLVVALSGCLADVEASNARETWFGFTSSGLQEKALDSGSHDVDWGWEDYVSGQAPPSWSSGAFDDGALITEATLTIVFLLENVVATEQPARPLSRPPLTAWFGTQSGQVIAHEFYPGPSGPVIQDATVEAIWEIELPIGGLYVPAGDALKVQVGSYYAHDNGVKIDGAWSMLEVAMKPVRNAPVLFDSGTASVNVAGGACVVRDPSATIDQQLRDQATASVEFDVPAGSRFVDVSASTMLGDVDFWVEDSNGQQMGHALGPGSQEALFLGPDAVRGNGGAWSIHAYACSVTDGTIDLAWNTYF